MKAKLILVSSLAMMLATAGTTFAASGYGQGPGTNAGLNNAGEQQYVNCQGIGNAEGDGICNLSESSVGTGTGAFVDNDGDGICDDGGGTHLQDGSGIQRGGRNL